ATAARRQAVAACLAMAGARPGAPVALTRIAGDGWAVLEIADTRVACTMLEISGVALPVAVALATRRSPGGSPVPPAPAAAPAAAHPATPGHPVTCSRPAPPPRGRPHSTGS